MSEAEWKSVSSEEAEVKAAERTIYTIGHSNHELNRFLEMLDSHKIQVLVDTRSRPNSRYVPHYDVERLRPEVEGIGIRFVFMGQALGGRPNGPEFYDAEGHVLYDRVAQHPDFLTGIKKLETGVTRRRIALMCSEENPAACHRRLLVGRVLLERGLNLIHLRADGRQQTEVELVLQEKGSATGQAALFEVEEIAPWRSIQSVLPRRPPSNSSQR